VRKTGFRERRVKHLREREKPPLPLPGGGGSSTEEENHRKGKAYPDRLCSRKMTVRLGMVEIGRKDGDEGKY
jgi:hypothetical protein